MIDLNGMQRTADQTLLHMGEHTKTVFVGIDGILALLRLFKNIGVPFRGFEVGTQQGRFRKNRDNPVELRLTDANVVPRAAAL